MWEKTSSLLLPSCCKMPTTQWRKHSKVGRRTKFNSSVVLHDKIIPYVFCLPQQHYSTEQGHFVLSHTIFKTKNIQSKMDRSSLIWVFACFQLILTFYGYSETSARTVLMIKIKRWCEVGFVVITKKFQLTDDTNKATVNARHKSRVWDQPWAHSSLTQPLETRPLETIETVVPLC